MATVGEDFAAYSGWLAEQSLDTRYLREIPATLTAQAFITTDLDDNQIAGFYPTHILHIAINLFACIESKGTVYLGDTILNYS